MVREFESHSSRQKFHIGEMYMKKVIFAVLMAFALTAVAVEKSVMEVVVAQYEQAILDGVKPIDILKDMLADGIDPKIVFELALAMNIDLSSLSAPAAGNTPAPSAQFVAAPAASFSGGGGGGGSASRN